MSVKIPHGYNEIVAVYGNPAGRSGQANPNWEAANLIDFVPPYPFLYEGDHGNTPIKGWRFHKLAAPDLAAILQKIYNSAREIVKKNDGYNYSSEYYDHRTLQVLAAYRCNIFSGAYNYRDKRGQPGVPSVHSFGVAIDFDAAHNAFGSQRGTLPAWFISAFTDAGWEWGGSWQGRNKDWMHLQAATGF